MKTKVKSVQANGTYQNKFGLLYKFDYEFEDGKSLSANHKTQEGNFKPGDEVEYEIKGSNDYGSWGSVSKPKEEFKKNDDYVKGIEVGHAINNAVNMICAGVEFEDVTTTKTGQKIYEYAKHIMQISEKLKNE